MTHYFTADDDNRVVLNPLSERGDYVGDYINASYIDVCSMTVAVLIMKFTLLILHNTLGIFNTK